MYFANAEYIVASILKYVDQFATHSPVKYLVLEMTAVASVDSPAVHALKSLITVLKRRDIALALTTVNKDVEAVMRHSHLLDEIGQQWIHLRVHDAVLHCVAHELAKPPCPPAEVPQPVAHRVDEMEDGGADLRVMPA